MVSSPPNKLRGFVIKGRDGRGPQTTENDLSELITGNDIEGLGEAELQSKLYAIMKRLIRIEDCYEERTLTLASLATVEAELNRKRALKSKYPALRW